MIKQRLPQIGREADARVCRKILRCDTKQQACRREGQHQQEILRDDRFDISPDAGINQIRDNDRHEQIHQGFQQLEQRRENRLAAVAFQIDR